MLLFLNPNSSLNSFLQRIRFYLGFSKLLPSLDRTGQYMVGLTFTNKEFRLCLLGEARADRARRVATRACQIARETSRTRADAPRNDANPCSHISCRSSVLSSVEEATLQVISGTSPWILVERW